MCFTLLNSVVVFCLLHRAYLYQTGWTDQFHNSADVDFIVQGTVLPVHSAFFYQSSILQSCFTDTTNMGRPQLESCFRRYHVSHVGAFLCQLYPAADPERTILKNHCRQIVELAIHLECESVVRSVRSYLEDVPGVVLDDLKSFEALKFEKWFSAVAKLRSQKLEGCLVEFMCTWFDTIVSKFSDVEMSSILSNLSGLSVLHLLKGRDKFLRKEVSVRVEQGSSCTKCHHTVFSPIETYKSNRDGLLWSKSWTCPRCMDFKVTLNPWSFS